jgi:hypothetical protein
MFRHYSVRYLKPKCNINSKLYIFVPSECIRQKKYKPLGKNFIVLSI